MLFTVNGIGTGLVAASKRRKVDGHTQFDAVEALMVFYLPVVPYKTIHVVSEQGAQHNAIPVVALTKGQRYQWLPLRMSRRIVAKAFLNRWGNVLAGIGGLCAIVAVAFALSEPRIASDDAWLIAAFSFIGCVGVAAKLLWWRMDRVDQRVKDMIGPHQFGTSDPLHWPDELAAPVAESLLQTATAPSLSLAASRALQAGDHAKAMVCARLAMRDPRDFEARDLCDRLLAL